MTDSSPVDSPRSGKSAQKPFMRDTREKPAHNNSGGDSSASSSNSTPDNVAAQRRRRPPGVDAASAQLLEALDAWFSDGQVTDAVGGYLNGACLKYRYDTVDDTEAAAGESKTDVPWAHENRKLFSDYSELIDRLLDDFVDKEFPKQRAQWEKESAQRGDGEDSDNPEFTKEEFAMSVVERCADASDDPTLRCRYLSVSYVAAAVDTSSFEELLAETLRMLRGGAEDEHGSGDDSSDTS